MKIEKGLFEKQRDVKTETTFISYVARRKLNFQQLENVLGTSLPPVIKGFVTMRDAKIAENSYDKVVCDDVVRALVRLYRLEMRLGTSGQSDQTVPTYFTDPELDAPTISPVSEIWTQPSMNDDALQKGRRLMRGRRDDDRTRRSDRHSRRVLLYRCWSGEIEENEVPQILLQARPPFRHLGYRAIRQDLNAVQKSRGLIRLQMKGEEIRDRA